MKNKKKIFTLSALLLASTFTFAQDDALSKKVRFGLMVSPSVNWLKSGEKITEKNGSSVKFGGGLGIEFRLTDVAVFATGLMINTSGGKIKNKNDLSNNPSTSYVQYFYDTESESISEFLPAYEAYNAGGTQTRYVKCVLNERSYNITYVTIPLTLKLRTKEIGALTYYGMFGVNSSIRVAAKATDKIQKPISNVPSNTPIWGSPETISKTDVKDDVSLFNESLNMGLGVEWNLSGSTSLVIGANYLLGFTNAVSRDSDYQHKVPGGGPFYGSPLKQSLKTNSIALTVGVLF